MPRVTVGVARWKPSCSMAISAKDRSQHETIGNCVNEVKKKQLNNIFNNEWKTLSVVWRFDIQWKHVILGLIWEQKLFRRGLAIRSLWTVLLSCAKKIIGIRWTIDNTCKMLRKEIDRVVNKVL